MTLTPDAIIAAMTILASCCVALAIADGMAALYYGLQGRAVSLLFTANFALLGGLVMVGVFG